MNDITKKLEIIVVGSVYLRCRKYNGPKAIGEATLFLVSWTRDAEGCDHMMVLNNC